MRERVSALPRDLTHERRRIHRGMAVEPIVALGSVDSHCQKMDIYREGALGSVGTLEEELKGLCRGRGVMASDLRERLGLTLCAMADIDPGGQPDEVRKRLIGFLEEATAGLPEDLRTAFAAALALRQDVQHAFLDGRMQWLADHIQRDKRSARRRVSQAIKRVAGSLEAWDQGSDDPYGDWYLARLSTVLRLDGTQPTAVEDRTVVANRAGLTKILISTNIPRAPGADTEDLVPEFTVLSGGTLVESARPTPTYFRYTIQLAHPLRRGEAHELSTSLTIPSGLLAAPQYAFQPILRCDELQVRILFGPQGQSKRVWKISGLARGMVDGFDDPAALMHPDAAGDIELCYRHLLIGRAYGARWAD